MPLWHNYPRMRIEGDIMLKKLFGFILVLFLLTGCVRSSDGEPVEQEADSNSEEVTETEETSEPDEEPEETEEDVPRELEGSAKELDDTLTFDRFTINMDQVEVYEEDSNYYADISFDWLNQPMKVKRNLYLWL